MSRYSLNNVRQRRGAGSRRMLTLLAALATCAGLALSACSSPPSRFYTLAGGSTPGAARNTAAPALMIEVAPVDMPAQVARTAFVVHTSANRVDVLEQTRWAALPADEIRQALSQDLTQRLDAIDVSRSLQPAAAPVYRVNVSVQRFESWPDSHALIDAVWTVRALSDQTVLTCRSIVSEPASGGDDALVAAHRRALGQIAANLAAGIRALDTSTRVSRSAPGATRSVPCPV
ncbi:PqiC family protein [Paraburkholderia sp. MPAMCS5]|uniref:PqiC family protein n=1 Tax=Paraburkholderia sp. MPAMCS5 TaxID=3112563 RepID=UPI003FA7C0FD